MAIGAAAAREAADGGLIDELADELEDRVNLAETARGEADEVRTLEALNARLIDELES